MRELLKRVQIHLAEAIHLADKEREIRFELRLRSALQTTDPIQREHALKVLENDMLKECHR